MRRKVELDEELKILLVDDDRDLLDSIKHMLNSQGYYCITNDDPEKTVELIKKENIDILIIDYIMVEVTGLQIVRQVRAFNSEIYIILLTTHVKLMPPIQALRNYDIDSYSEKNPNYDDLIQKVIIADKTINKYQKYNSDTDVQNFPANLKRLRSKSAITQEQLGELLGVTRSTIASYENGINHPSIKQMRKLAEHFGVSIDYLLGNDSK